MSTRLSSWASRRLDRTDRRGFLTRTAVFGSAVVTAPKRFALEPTSAYAAVCSCSGQTCGCSQLCCDGYTEFCCTIYGRNDCPPGSIVAGWWKADGSGFCDDGGPRPRYYLDCNASCSSGCGCGGSGVCSSSCSSCAGRGRCANGDCNNRKTCRTLFRYGQCNNDVRCVGPIICRVVTCTPPWTITKFDCNATVATDNRTARHHRPCLLESDPANPPPPEPDKPVPDDAVFVPGVWTSDGIAGPAFFSEGTWSLRDTADTGAVERTFTFGQAGDIPVVGDWDGDGVDGIGVVRDGRHWLLRNSLSAGPPDVQFSFGRPGDVPVVGDWNGDRIDEPGVVRNGREWYLRSQLSGGNADITFQYGRPGDVPVSGDWNGDGVDEPGVVRDGREWYLRHEVAGGPADVHFIFGRTSDTPVTAEWGHPGRPGPGVVRDLTSWFVRHNPDAGGADRSFTFPSDEPEPRTGEVGRDDTTVPSE